MKRFFALLILLLALLMSMTAIPAAADIFLDVEGGCTFDYPVGWEKKTLYLMESTLTEEERTELERDYKELDVLYKAEFSSAGSGAIRYGSRDISDSFQDVDYSKIDTAFYLENREFEKSPEQVSINNIHCLRFKEALSTTYIHVRNGYIYQFAFLGKAAEQDRVEQMFKSVMILDRRMIQPTTYQAPHVPNTIQNTAKDPNRSKGASPSSFLFLVIIVVVIVAVVMVQKGKKEKAEKEKKAFTPKPASFTSKPSAPLRGYTPSEAKILQSNMPMTREEATDVLIHMVMNKSLTLRNAGALMNRVLMRCPELRKVFTPDEKERFIRYVCPIDPANIDQPPTKQNNYTLRIGGSGYRVERHAIGDLLEYSVRIVDRKPQVYFAYVDDWGLLYNYETIPIPSEIVKDITPEKLVKWMKTDANVFDYSVENVFGFSYASLENDENLKKWCAVCNREFASVRDASKSDEEAELDDVSYINQMNHTPAGAWQRYVVLLAARPYGWADCVAWAEYMSKADLEAISTVTTALISGAPETERIDEFKTAGGISSMTSLETECGVLAVGGISKTLRMPVKIVFYNQTKTLELLTFVTDESLMTRYIETCIRRTFGTPDAMKRARPYEG